MVAGEMVAGGMVYVVAVISFFFGFSSFPFLTEESKVSNFVKDTIPDGYGSNISVLVYIMHNCTVSGLQLYLCVLYNKLIEIRATSEHNHKSFGNRIK